MSTLPLDRRTFLSYLGAAGGTVAAGSLAGCGDPPHHAMPTEPALASAKGSVVRYPLRIPPTVSPNGLVLSAGPASVTIVPGKTTPAWLYNGLFPGPTIQATSGGPWSVTFQNGLTQESITHWHGLLVSPANDGHPRQAVGPQGQFAYNLVINQRAGLDWYHPHPHMRTGEQVYRGLAGAFVVRDGIDTGLPGNAFGLPTGASEIPLIIRDATFDSTGAFQFSNKSSGFWGNTPLVNGTYAPYLEVARGVYRFRVLNGCNARLLRLGLGSGGAFTLIGNDGGLLDRVYSVTEITAAPGERLDLLLDFAGLAAGATVMLKELNTGWGLLEFRGTGAAGSGMLPSGTLTSITPLANPVTTRRFTFDGMTRINGKVYDIDANEFDVPFDTTERWVFVTNGNGPHPVHVHGALFQVQSRTGGRGRTYEWEGGWKDTSWSTMGRRSRC